MDAANEVQYKVAQYAGPRQKAVDSLTLPCVLAVVATLAVATLDSIQRQRVSPVFLLAAVFTGVGAICAAYDVDAKTLDFIFASWRRVMAFIVLGWMSVTFFIVDYHSSLHDLGCIRAGGAFLVLLAADDARESIGYVVLHFVVSLGAKVPNYAEEMLLLLVADMFMIYATWTKHISTEALEQLTTLSRNISTYSFKSVQNTLLYLCDAVVVLDKDLELREDAPELGSLLGRTCCPGRNFQELVHHEDLESFKATVGQGFDLLETGDQTQHEAMQVRLLDSYGGPFSVHVFIAAVNEQAEDVEQPRFLLGISEQWHRRKKDSVGSMPVTTTAPAKLRSGQGLRGRSGKPAAHSDESWLDSSGSGSRSTCPVGSSYQSTPQSDPEFHKVPPTGDRL